LSSPRRGEDVRPATETCDGGGRAGSVRRPASRAPSSRSAGRGVPGWGLWATRTGWRDQVFEAERQARQAWAEIAQAVRTGSSPLRPSGASIGAG